MAEGSAASCANRRPLVLIAAGFVCLASIGCPPPPVPPTPPPPDAEELPGRYLAQGTGTVTIGGEGIEPESVRGRLQAAYIVYPDDRVVVTHLAARLDDVDLVVPFLWWEAEREPLRCTSFVTRRTAVGELGGGGIQLPAESLRMAGTTYSARKDPKTCGGEVRGLSAENPAPVTITHDPDGNSFGFSGVFSADHQGNDFAVTIDLEGDFVNRPPTARLAHGSPGGDDDGLVDGCPDPKSIADSERGLRLRLLSKSEDPDPHAYVESNLKLPRADLRREDWLRSVDGAFEFLGEGREIEEVVFAPERDHVLLLTVTDQSGARAREICEFFVARQPDSGAGG